MSKFDYKAEGELNSQYLLDLLQDYLDKIKLANDTKGIEEDSFNVNIKANRFARWFKHKTTCFKLKWKSDAVRENYNNIVSTKYADLVKEKIDIYLQTNVLNAKQIFDLQQTLKAIHFDVVIPEIDEQRYKAIKQSQKRLLKCLNDIKYLADADIDYVLYNSPVNDLKPFLSHQVSLHKVSYIELQKLVRQYVAVHYNELTTFNFEPYDVKFQAKARDFYDDKITDNGVGEDVESFIVSKMLEKFDIMSQDDTLLEDRQEQVAEIDVLLKKLKVSKIEQMMQKLIQLKTNKAHVKEVMDNCKDAINSSTIPNKAGIFLIMDNLYYSLSKKCENLQQKVKLKLQLVDKQKLFNMIERLQAPADDLVIDDEDEESIKEMDDEKLEDAKTEKHKKGIATDLYDDDEPEEIDITEDDGTVAPEDEIVIDEEN